ncbi:MAG: IS66 family insertion sequence element accessory protein TnpB [Mesorhizobium sp.]|uniref:IS66-like element accessory protein TnpA n=1 Tax=Mesorhizobium sp. TaxID=1871066 RepID=UPI00120770C8|nr:transposase [Mesorhizobium sp.]TIP26309.1 MAG: IS66 family insertion sequence element accessory protein TnpB [Mesorhizobium sp.]
MEWDDTDASRQGRHEDSHYRRVEVVTGRRRRPNWTPAEKARIVAESAEPGANISAVARHWGVNRGFLPIWRRQAGLVQAKAAAETTPALQFVPITIAGEDRQLDHTGAGKHEVPTSAGRIELEIGESRLVLTGSVDPALAAAIVDALRVPR